jgi:hypothetical protein
MNTLLHFSEDPEIKVFRPHVARTAVEREALVWAVDETHAPSFWFPRQCPRACCWRHERDTSAIARALLGGAARMHAVEEAWLERIEKCVLYAYRFEEGPFVSHLAEAGYWTTKEEVRPLSVEPVGDLLERHQDAGIALRVVPNLWPVIDQILGSGLRFSIIRKANAQPRLVS